MTHICVSNLTTTGSVNGLSPGRHQAITWTNAGILLIGPLGTNFSEILIRIPTFSFKKMRLKISSARWRPFCLGLNVLNESILTQLYFIFFSKNISSLKWLTFSNQIKISIIISSDDYRPTPKVMLHWPKVISGWPGGHTPVISLYKWSYFFTSAISRKVHKDESW